MSDLVDRLRRWAADAPPWIAMPYAGEAADRIDALEAECDRWAEQANTTAASLRTKVKTLEADNQRLQSCIDEREEALRTIANPWANQLPRIEALEAAMRQSVDDWRERGRRIEVLEAVLRATAKAVEALAFEMPPPNPYTPQFVMIAHTARAALAEGQDK